MATAIMKGENLMKKRIISISSKRQITIPQKFYTLLGFSDEAEMILKDNEIILRPAKKYVSSEFDEDILSDLIKEGFSGEKLLEEFKIRKSEIRMAVEKMILQSENAAAGKGEYYSYDDVFGSEE